MKRLSAAKPPRRPCEKRPQHVTVDCTATATARMDPSRDPRVAAEAAAAARRERKKEAPAASSWTRRNPPGPPLSTKREVVSTAPDDPPGFSSMPVAALKAYDEPTSAPEGAKTSARRSAEEVWA